ncbi:MAG TPA: glycogen synthase [Steroidobacteraceae bacterium]|jgi:starch synthase|nr:glycogen synthase [Steroidobacteraceae bacterium]
MEPLKVCIVSAEIMPFAKTGGLSDVVGALLREFAQLGHDVRAFMPLYASVRKEYPAMGAVLGVQNVGLTIGNRRYAFSLRTADLPGTKIAVHFIDCPELFDRPWIYTRDPDEHRRFLLFTRAAVESCLRLGFAPDIFHCHDWHTGFLPLFLKTLYAPVPLFAGSRSVLTVHNIGYQGVVSRDFIEDLGLPDAERLLDPGDLQQGVINPLKTGLKFADTVTTVSPTYAREITETSLGFGLEATLRARANPVIGILNGVDYREWDPRHDKYLTANFSPEDLSGKSIDKRTLLGEAGLDRSPDRPLIGMVTRLASQKGIDLLVDSLPNVLERRDFGLVVLGSGEERYVLFLESLAARHPRRVAFHSAHDERFAHWIEAGSDIFLMPSQYEPCGLNQMYSLRYGTIPIVRRTGGLADSVRHFDPSTGEGTGCVFNDYDAPAVEWALNTTLDWFARPPIWQRLVDNAMREDFSWALQVGRYVEVFRATLAQPVRRSNA